MGNRIKELRESRDLTQQQLADLVGSTKQQIGRLEKSQRQLTEAWMQRLARALQCHPAELLEAPAVPPISPEEQALLDLYRSLGDGDRKAIFRHADALAQPPAGSDRKKQSG